MLFSLSCLRADISYEVQFKGIDKGETETLLRSVSQLITLQECPPATITALYRRAEAEIPRLITTLQGRAYYDAHIELTIDQDKTPVLVIFEVSLGEVYPLTSFEILPSETDQFRAYESFQLEEIGVVLEQPAEPKVILDAEEAVVDLLAQQGYPFAEVTKREVIADQKAKNVAVRLTVNSGLLAYFGTTHISGLKKVRQSLVRRKIAWREGDIYDPELLQETFNSLDCTGLFANIQVTPGECQEGDNRVPIDIDLSEGRHRSIGLGGTFATQWGGGLIAEWEHRNIRGLGERITLKTELMQKLQSGSGSYCIPEFLSPTQDLTTKAEARHEITQGFHDTSAMLSTRINRRLNKNLQISAGLAYKYLTSEDSDNNSCFNLAKIPLQLLYNNTGCPLDPSRGVSVNLRLTPTYQVVEHNLNYYTTTLDAAYYLPFDSEAVTVFASKVSFGSIVGASRLAVPPPERLYAGSPQTLRGYRYLTVSPLNEENKPIGGRSLLVFSFELRRRLAEDWGGVLFYEVGNVYAATWPDLFSKQLQSTGIGIRYYTAVGPLRLDIAFPLNRRKSVDGRFQIYFSIGQTF